ncbi:Signal transduction histidine kinase [Desulfopila aestuarii DSM 18488]|uniref:histidine kinase n=2 Tax=Desulfopila aestuarii TaxID=231440 RepID=A0A1M7XXE0_9BACT|nr:Signal transduction histidine kinase [Desulfopila aestuarii DSM 18488]
MQSQSAETIKPYKTLVFWEYFVIVLIAGGAITALLLQFLLTGLLQHLILSFLVLLFVGAQLSAMALQTRQVRPATWIWGMVFLLSFTGLLLPIFVANALVLSFCFLAAIPFFIVRSGEIRQLPRGLLITFSVAAGAVFLDLGLIRLGSRLELQGERLPYYCGACLALYVFLIGGIRARERRLEGRSWSSGLNFTTQFSLIISGISAVVIGIVMSVLISQIRSSQIDQVGRNYQTIAENFARIAGAHLEQQLQTLRLLTQQVPIFQTSLLTSRVRYYGDRDKARTILEAEDRYWSGPIKDNPFVINYLNSPVMKALSDFRGRNSFHSDIVLVDSYGGLVASLGKKPEHFFFYDQNWWQLAWNGGLGNSYIGDLSWSENSPIPRLRLAVEIIDNTSNEVIGILSSMYLLRTLIEDMQRFKPDTVEQINLLDATGKVVASSSKEIEPRTVWVTSGSADFFSDARQAGWELGLDHEGKAALIGYSSLSTEYHVISDPLRQLGWHVAVSGTRTNALSDVTRSTKLAMLFGLLTIALGVFIAILTARVITRPIENLTATAMIMGDGDLTKRARPEGADELVALADSFNRLTSRLHEVISNLQSQTEQLSLAKAEAETATRLKGEFLANMSHEIRTPLNAILGFADIMETITTDEVMKRHARIIKTSGTDLLHLINDILDLSKIEAGRMEIQPEPISLAQLCEELKRIFSVNAKKKGIQLEVQVSSALPPALILDGKRLKQVLFNLIGNAIKFTEHGKVNCRVEGQPLRESGKWRVKISVRDTGFGIAADERQKIFESFHQQTGKAAIVAEGTGLGLTISKSLVEMMQGSIEVESELGVGSLFTIVFPEVRMGQVKSERAGVNIQSDDTDELQLGPATVLVVDDLDINRHLVVETLKRYPLTLVQAENGNEALRAMADKRFDLVLMDIRMPGMDGFTTLKKSREIEGMQDVPIIAITASGMTDEIEKIENSGFDNYLIRPFNRPALLELVAQYLPSQRGERPDSPALADEPVSVEADEEILELKVPQSAYLFLTRDIQQQLQFVEKRQSMPEIIAFAEEVKHAGEEFGIAQLVLFGTSLEEDAHAFDIEGVERKLKYFGRLLAGCTVR